MVMENSIYEGFISHRRFLPKLHQFTYKIFMFCFDIDNIPGAFKDTRWFSLERFNWFSFKRKNHLGPVTEPLSQSVRDYIHAKTGKTVTGKIYLLTHLATMGYCFNPISLYMVLKPDSDELDMLLTEVTNTPWAERHVYVLDSPAAIKKNIYQYIFNKSLHVSPFMEMNHEYHLNFKIDQNQLILHMDSYQNREHIFDASLSLTSQSLNKTNVHKIMRRYPFITYKVTAAIYWEALKLFIKRVPFYAHPKS